MRTDQWLVVWTQQPLVVIPLAWLVFQTAITGWHLAGGFNILLGAMALAVFHHKGAAETIEIVATNDAKTG